MKVRSAVIVVLALSATSLAEKAKTPATTQTQPGDLKSDKARISYAIGMMIASQFKRTNADIDPEIVSQAIGDVFAGRKPRLTEDQARMAMMSWRKQMMAKQASAAKVLGKKNKAEGEAFLAKNKKEEGVVTLPSGLQYKVIKEGTGQSPKADDQVTVHYRGTLINGQEFDSSYARNKPATFKVGGVIPGWTEALQLMKPGAKWKLFIPSKLAYHERGRPPKIGPNAALLFDIELLSVKSPAGGAK
jgi:FKBP-type peptidyl-prolyl cis-trans isomerase FklB